MAEKTIITCDVCGKEGAQPISFCTGRSFDGHRDDDDIEQRDLCPDHAHAILQGLAGSLAQDQGRALREKIDKWGIHWREKHS